MSRHDKRYRSEDISPYGVPLTWGNLVYSRNWKPGELCCDVSCTMHCNSLLKGDYIPNKCKSYKHLLIWSKNHEKIQENTTWDLKEQVQTLVATKDSQSLRSEEHVDAFWWLSSSFWEPKNPGKCTYMLMQISVICDLQRCQWHSFWCALPNNEHRLRKNSTFSLSTDRA